MDRLLFYYILSYFSETSKFIDMKTFKKIDCWINLLLIVFFFIYSLIKLDDSFIYGYFIVGGWQILSMLVHVFTGNFTSKPYSRYYYHGLIIFLLIVLLIGWFLNPLAFVVLIGLLFAAPIMAVIYSIICYNELTINMKRPLDDLK